MTTKVIRVLFAAVDGKEETIAKMRDIVFYIFKIVYTLEGRGNVVSLGRRDEGSAVETHTVEVDSLYDESSRCQSQWRFQLQKEEKIVWDNFDVVVLFCSSSFIFARDEKEFWLPFLLSFFTRVAPRLSHENLSKLSTLYAELRKSGGSYRLQNDVWVTVDVDGSDNIGVEDCKHDWQQALRTLQTVPGNQVHIHSSRTLFLEENNVGDVAGRLWNYMLLQ